MFCRKQLCRLLLCGEAGKIREVKSGGAQDHAGIHPSLFWAEIKRKIKEKCFIIN
jgi:hypothetical protein